MKVLGIGNAIVDVICKVEDSFLSKSNLTKSAMKLVDETEFKKMLRLIVFWINIFSNIININISTLSRKNN